MSVRKSVKRAVYSLTSSVAPRVSASDRCSVGSEEFCRCVCVCVRCMYEQCSCR